MVQIYESFIITTFVNFNCFKKNSGVFTLPANSDKPKLLIGMADGSIKLPAFDWAMELGIIDHACKACSAAFSATDAAQKLGVPLKGELSGHSDFLKFAAAGYSTLTF